MSLNKIHISYHFFTGWAAYLPCLAESQKCTWYVTETTTSLETSIIRKVGNTYRVRGCLLIADVPYVLQLYPTSRKQWQI